MRFLSLDVRNMRAVERFSVDTLTDFVMIAGQNGSGKSCVFDAIRLLKSFYGGYQADEHMQWFGEFSINVQDRRALGRLFRDSSKSLFISAVIEFAQSEREYLGENVEDLAWPIAWQRVTGQRLDPWTFNRMAIATQLEQFKAPIDAQLVAIERDVKGSLAHGPQVLGLEITPDGDIKLVENRPAEVAFQAYRPENLGIIEYHSASRAYVRQEVGGINLDSRQFKDQRRQQTLYNWQGKYQNVKTELATAYVRNLISTESGETPDGEDLNETLKQLFQTFFPDKTYEGVRPQPGGNLEFPVRLQNGSTHDIDDLSSGEKEILYGYLRLRNATPRNSVVLLDEPELHLNPSLLQGFPDFYHKHLGEAQNNQLWLVTHSDTLLRQTVGNANYRVYHMLVATALSAGDNQAAEVVLDDDVERATIDLVGDLASYRPHAKVVILEGDSSSGLDVTMIKRLFPDAARRVNLVSGGSKRRVRDLYRVLAEAVERTGISNRFFAIVDRDAGEPLPVDSGAQEYTWDVYHIENYLLDLPSIQAAVVSLTGNDPFGSDDSVREALQECAKQIVDRLVLEKVQGDLNDQFRRELEVKASPDSQSVAADLLPSIEGSANRIAQLAASLDLATLESLVAVAQSELETSLEDGTWLTRFPGRLILRRFADQHVGGVKYETMANAILDKMASNEVAPPGMKVVLDRILEA
ncbi:MAG: hypothetical protein JWQ32_3436 [Marmoricola sp.]|nr:hypothetical protein [Marmoricola sp.]